MVSTKSKTMTTEELLKPRYKVIADYPMQFYSIGEVIETANPQSCSVVEGEYWQCDLDKYPAIFKKLAWWEERKESEMPGYVKCRFHCCCDVRHYAKDEIYHNLSIEDIKTNFFLPATEVEYLEQNQKPQ